MCPRQPNIPPITEGEDLPIHSENNKKGLDWALKTQKFLERQTGAQHNWVSDEETFSCVHVETAAPNRHSLCVQQHSEKSSPVIPSILFKMFHLCLISLTIIAFLKGKVPVCSVFSTRQSLQGSGHPSCPPLCRSQQMNYVIDFIALSTSLYFGVYWCHVWVFISSKSHTLINSVTLSWARSFGWITTGYKSTAQLSGSRLARS